MKGDKTKELFIEQLKRTPLIQAACEKVGIARSTIYRWKSEDKEFAKEVEEAIYEGERLITDLAQSKLISAIQDQNMSAIALWLRAHHEKYKQKMEISGQIKKEDEELTPEQKEIVERALKLSSFITKENIIRLNKKKDEK